MATWIKSFPTTRAAASVGCLFFFALLAHAESPQPPAERTFVFNLGAEPRSLDPGKSTTIDASVVLRNLFEGLTRPMPDGTVEAGAAERWEVAEDGVTYTFHLRPDGRWSNGDRVTAHDFVYAWLRVLRPDFASEYAYVLYQVEGAQAYNEGKAGHEVVALEAVDDLTLRMKLVGPAPWWPGFLDHSTCLPVHRDTDIVQPEWSQAAANYVSNGPYRLASIEPRQSLTLEPNPYHRDEAKIGLRRIQFRMIVDDSTTLLEFRNGRLHGIISDPPVADVPLLRDEGLLQNIPNLGTYFLCFNVTRAPFDNRDTRQAFVEAIGRRNLTRLLRTGVKPALSFVPPGIPTGDGRDFRDLNGDLLQDGDATAAQAALVRAGYPGGKGFPPVVYIYNTDDQHKVVAEYCQSEWKRLLGVETRLQNMEWKVLNQSRQEGNFQIARHGWIGDYRDPMTFLDMWITGSGNNNAQWSNAEYDSLITQARTERDAARRMDLMAKAERILVEDFVICPIYHYTQNYYETDEVEGIERSMMMTIRFDRARWVN